MRTRTDKKSCTAVKVHQNRIIFRMGRRIYFRPLFREDAPTLARWINDPEITQFLKADRPIPPERELEFIDRVNIPNGRDVVLGIALTDTDELIGTMGLHHISHKDGLASTGSIIGRKDLWGKGYGTEAKMILLEYAFNTLNLRKICSIVYDFNPRSKRCMEKCGYQQEGCRKEHHYRNGRYCDEYVMAVFKDEFLRIWEERKKEFLPQGG